MAISMEEFNVILEKLTQHLINIAKSGNDMLARKAIEFMEQKWKELNEILNPLWFQKQVVSIMRENNKKKILAGEKDV